MNKFIEKNFIIKKDYKEIIRIVGIVLIGLGFLDIIVHVQFFLVQGGNFRLNFNLLPIIFGVFLIRGNLKAVRIAIFVLGSYILFSSLSFLFLFIFMPFDYNLLSLIVNFGNNPLPLIVSFLFFIIYLWSFVNLTRRKVIDGLAEKGHKFKKPWEKIYAGMIVGAVFSIIMMTTMAQLLKGENADIAIEKAKEKYGNEYKYAVTHMNISKINEKTIITAQVAAYNNTEINYLTVRW